MKAYKTKLSTEQLIYNLVYHVKEALKTECGLQVGAKDVKVITATVEKVLRAGEDNGGKLTEKI